MDLDIHPEMTQSVKEVFFRINELRFAFGNNDDHFCTQIQDYVKVLLSREKDRLKYRGTSLIRHHRYNIIEFVMKVVEIEGYTRATLHLAIYLFDRYQDFYNIPRVQLYTVLISCIIIAGKIEEKDSKTPKIKNLKHYIPPVPCYSAPKFREMELHILSYVKWYIIVPTSYTFMEFFLLFALDADETPNSPPVNQNEAMVLSINMSQSSKTESTSCGGDENNNNCKKKKVVIEQRVLDDPGFSCRNVNAIRSFALEVLDSLLYEEPDEALPPSLLAAATLMFARRCYGFYGWTNRLYIATTYDEETTLKCCREYVEKKHIEHLVLPCYNN